MTGKPQAETQLSVLQDPVNQGESCSENKKAEN